VAVALTQAGYNLVTHAFPAHAERVREAFGVLDEAEKRWAEMEKPWAGRKVVVYHKEYDYLIEACGLKLVGSIDDDVEDQEGDQCSQHRTTNDPR